MRLFVLAAALASTASAGSGAATGTRSEAGVVQSAADRTSPDGASWRVYWAGDSCHPVSGGKGEGTVGALREGYFAGEVGGLLPRFPQAGDLHVVVVEKAARPGGYYAVSDRVVAPGDPLEFPPLRLRAVPRPRVARSPEGVVLRWDAAAEDSVSGPHIVGYHVWRQQGALVRRLTRHPVSSRFFLDGEPAEDARWSLSLALRGSPCWIETAVRSAPVGLEPDSAAPKASSVRTVPALGRTSDQIRVVPNPVTGPLASLELPGEPGTRYAVRILDAAGSRVSSAEISSPGADLPAPEAAGIYVLIAQPLPGGRPHVVRFARLR